MKAFEFIEKLEEGELIGFTEKEKEGAVRLARLYSGRVVLSEWKAWSLKEHNSFTMFALELPQILKDKEAALKEPAEKTENREKDNIKGENPFDKVKGAFENKTKKENPEAGRKQASCSPMQPKDDLWVYDENIGWTVHGCPVY